MILTVTELDMLADAAFQRAGEARSGAEERRWLALESKVRAESLRLSNRGCGGCGHRFGAHSLTRGRCHICECSSFEEAAS